MLTVPTFELRPGGGDLGLWRADRPLAGSQPDTTDTVTWHGDVAAVGDLRALRRHVDAATDALPDASGRLLRTVREADSSASFGPPGTTVAPEPERAEYELLAWLDECSPGDGRVAFGGPDQRWWAQAERDLAELLARLRSWVAPTALVRTTSGDRAVALTAHRWSGRTVTAAAAGASGPELRLHDDLFELVAASRRIVVRVVGLTVEGAVRIGTRLALPGGPLLALPATWRFVHRVLDEVEGAGR
jgi:hypothetical protein